MPIRFSVTSNSPAPETGIAARALDYAQRLGGVPKLLGATLRRWAHLLHAP
ncbi:MAG: hypothetical protein HYZ40_16070 [Rhodospirillales bacterium]|nr:hypothetical protein [Rhodospirillales bacterium]